MIALKEVTIDVNDINVGKKLGNGHFGAVYEGESRVSIYRLRENMNIALETEV